MTRRETVLFIGEASLRATRVVALTPLVSLLLTAGCTGSGEDAADGAPIVVGASLELTGVNVDIGRAYEQALRLKVEQLEAAGALRGRTIRLDIRDNRGDVTVAGAQMAEFGSNSDVTAAVMGVCAECVVAAAPGIAAKSLPTVALAPSPQVSSPVSERRFLFQLAPNADHNATALFDELGRVSPPVRSIGLLTAAGAYGRSAKEAMTRELDGTPIRVGPAAQFSAAGDLEPAVRTITQTRPAPEAVVVMAFPEQARLAIAGLRSAGYKGQIFLDAGAAGDLFLAADTAALAENATLVFTPTLAIDDVIATTPANAARKRWFSDYTAKYGTYYAQASFAADAIQLITDAVGRAGSVTDRGAIRTAMETAQFDGLTGPIRFAPDNHSGLTPQSLTVLVARNGRWRLVA